MISLFNLVDIIIWIFNCSEKSSLQDLRPFTDLTQSKSLWKNWKILKVGNIWEKMDWVFHKPLKKKEFNTQQVPKLKKIGIRLIVKSKEIFLSMVKNSVSIQVWLSSNKSSRMLIQIKEEQWWKVSKPQEEQFYQLIGMMYQKKTTKEKIDHHHQKVKNGKKENYDSAKNKYKFKLFFEKWYNNSDEY